MKKIFKFGCLSIIALVALVVIIGMFSGGGTETTPTKEKAVEKPVEKDNHITKENYNKIVQGDALTGDGGMTIKEVTAILGEPENTMESQAGDMKIEDYTWTDGLLGATISISFTNGKVSNKLFMD